MNELIQLQGQMPCQQPNKRPFQLGGTQETKTVSQPQTLGAFSLLSSAPWTCRQVEDLQAVPDRLPTCFLKPVKIYANHFSHPLPHPSPALSIPGTLFGLKIPNVHRYPCAEHYRQTRLCVASSQPHSSPSDVCIFTPISFMGKMRHH